jgi:hypothetical protein
MNNILNTNPNIEFKNEIDNIHRDYYDVNPKNTFSKKTQKFDCAEIVSKSIPLSDLIRHTCYFTDDTTIYIDYLFFKTFAYPLNYLEIVEHILSMIDTVLEKHTFFDIRVNLKSFTLSAAERYRDVIDIFCTECFIKTNVYTVALRHLYIHNPPHLMNTIMKFISPFVDKCIKEKSIYL